MDNICGYRELNQVLEHSVVLFLLWWFRHSCSNVMLCIVFCTHFYSLLRFWLRTSYPCTSCNIFLLFAYTKFSLLNRQKKKCAGENTTWSRSFPPIVNNIIPCEETSSAGSCFRCYEAWILRRMRHISIGYVSDTNISRIPSHMYRVLRMHNLWIHTSLPVLLGYSWIRTGHYEWTI